MPFCPSQPGTKRAGHSNRSIPEFAGIPFVVPADVGDWVGACDLMLWSEEEAEWLAWNQPNEPFSTPIEEADGHSLGSLLAYSYARGVFTSEEIKRKCQTDIVFRLLSDGKSFFAHELRRFRRKNRAALSELLARIFRRALEHKFGRRHALEEPLRASANERLDLARHLDTAD